MKTSWGAAVTAIGLALACRGQIDVQPRPKRPDNPGKQPTPNLRVDTNLVLVPVTVSDPMNRTVTGLEKENFRLFDDGVEQTIARFVREDEPIAVGFVFDTSGSMGAKLNRSRLAAREFFKTSNPEDEFFLVEFDSSPKLLVPLTRDIGEIENQVLFSRFSSHRVKDNIRLGISRFEGARDESNPLPTCFGVFEQPRSSPPADGIQIRQPRLRSQRGNALQLVQFRLVISSRADPPLNPKSHFCQA